MSTRVLLLSPRLIPLENSHISSMHYRINIFHPIPDTPFHTPHLLFQTRPIFSLVISLPFSIYKIPSNYQICPETHILFCNENKHYLKRSEISRKLPFTSNILMS